MDDLDRCVLHIFGESISSRHDEHRAFSHEIWALVGKLIVILVLRLIEDWELKSWILISAEQSSVNQIGLVIQWIFLFTI